MTIIYDVIAKRHEGCGRPDVVLFYDEDKETTVKFIRDYERKKGFTLEEKDGRFTIADIILRERYSTGEEISRKSYIELFDECGNRRKERGGEKSNMGYILTEYMVSYDGKKKPDFYFGGWHKKYADMIYIATKDTAYVFEDMEKARETADFLKVGGYNFQIEERAAG